MSESFERLIFLLKDDLTRTASLLAILDEEKEILIKSDFNLLPELASKKQELIDAIEKNNSEKVLLLKPLHQDQKKTKLTEELLAKYGPSQTAKLEELNHQLEEQLSLCREKNAVNGQAIIRSLKNNKKLTNIMTGKVEDSPLYNALGKSTNNNSPKPYHQKV
jgi:flagellar biosynthesis protein FlgN